MEESARKKALPGRRSYRFRVECGFWKHGGGFMRSLTKRAPHDSVSVCSELEPLLSASKEPG